MQSESFMLHPLTDLLLKHRQSNRLVGDLPQDVVPQTHEEAYRIQNESVARLGAVGAWKVQPLPQTGQPFAAPILASTIFLDGVTLPRADFPNLAIEVEVALTLNRDLPDTTGGYTAETVRSAIAGIHVALEVLSSRFVDSKSVPQLAGIADLQSGAGIVMGPTVSAETLPEFSQQMMELSFDGAVTATTPGNASTENMLASLAWLANHTVARGLPLKAGTIVITGARLGALPFAGQHVHAKAPGLGEVSATFE